MRRSCYSPWRSSRTRAGALRATLDTGPRPDPAAPLSPDALAIIAAEPYLGPFGQLWLGMLAGGMTEARIPAVLFTAIRGVGTARQVRTLGG